MSYVKSIDGSSLFLPTIHPVVVRWRDRAIAHGGSMPRGSSLIANSFINAITGSSYYTKIVYLLPMLGGNVNAALVPLIDTLGVGPATNSNFVDSDFSESRGLKGNGTNKILDSGIRPNQLGVSNNGGIGWWESDIDFGGTSVEPMGAYKSAASPDNRYVLDVRATVRAFRWGAAATYAYDNVPATNAHYYGQRSSSTNRVMCVNGVTKSANNTSDDTNGAGDNTIRICGSNEGSYGIVYWKGRCAISYMTDGTLTTDEISAFHSALNSYLLFPSGKLLAIEFDAINSLSYPGSGTNWYSAKSNHTASFTPDISYSSSDGGHFLFNGTNRGATLNASVAKNKGDQSLAAWIKPDAQSVNRPIIFESTPDAGGYTRFGMWYMADGTIRFGGRGVSNDPTGNFYGKNTTDTFSTGAWYHVIGVWDVTNTTIRIYVNGVEKSTNTIGAGTVDVRANTDPNVKYIGYDLSYYFSGKMGSIKLYDSAITSQQALDIYNSEKARFGL